MSQSDTPESLRAEADDLCREAACSDGTSTSVALREQAAQLRARADELARNARLCECGVAFGAHRSETLQCPGVEGWQKREFTPAPSREQPEITVGSRVRVKGQIGAAQRQFRGGAHEWLVFFDYVGREGAMTEGMFTADELELLPEQPADATAEQACFHAPESAKYCAQCYQRQQQLAEVDRERQVAWAQRDDFCASVNRIATMVGMTVENASWEAVERHVAALVAERDALRVALEEIAEAKPVSMDCIPLQRIARAAIANAGRDGAK